MPRITPLRDVRTSLVERGWTHLDALHAISAPEATAWTEGPALVASWQQAGTTIVHAIEESAFGPTTELLAGLLPALPRALELRVGSAAAGVLAETHQIEMIGPIQRMLWRRDAPTTPPPGVRFLGPADLAATAALTDRDAPAAPSSIPPGWLGWFSETGELRAMGGLLESTNGISRIAALRIRRGSRRDDALPTLLAAIAATAPVGDKVVLDLRMDRKDRVEIARRAGFRRLGGFERWRAKRA